MNFIFGGAAGMIATTLVLPGEFVKIQIQNRSEMGRKELNPLKVAKEIYKETGTIKTFYRGLDSALLRQVIYATTSFGLFYEIKDRLTIRRGKETNWLTNMICSVSSGAIACFLGTPCDLALVRMQSDNNLPLEQRRNYKNVFNALIRTFHEEGVRTLWRGFIPSVSRSIAVAFAVLPSFEELKKVLSPYIHNRHLKVVVSALLAGVAGSITSLPFDNLKTKLQKMKRLPDGTMPYAGVVDCFLKSVQKEGFLRLWVGYSAYYVRIGPYSVFAVTLNDAFRTIWGKNEKR